MTGGQEVAGSNPVASVSRHLKSSDLGNRGEFAKSVLCVIPEPLPYPSARTAQAACGVNSDGGIPGTSGSSHVTDLSPLLLISLVVI